MLCEVCRDKEPRHREEECIYCELATAHARVDTIESDLAMVRAMRDAFKLQRDALADALERLLDTEGHTGDGQSCWGCTIKNCKAMVAARAALKKAGR